MDASRIFDTLNVGWVDMILGHTAVETWFESVRASVAGEWRLQGVSIVVCVIGGDQLNGTGGIGENPDGWRTMRVSCPYSDPAQSCSFTPYLEVSAFNIPAADWGGRYMIYPTAYITVDWQ